MENNGLNLVSGLKNRQIGLEPDRSGANSNTASSRTSQMEFESDTNRIIPLRSPDYFCNGKEQSNSL